MGSREIHFIDEFFAGGAQHQVARLQHEADRLIKVPHKKGTLWDRSDQQSVAADIKTLMEKEISLPGNINVGGPCELVDKDNHRIQATYSIRMDWVEGRVFKEQDLDDPTLKDQMAEILHQSSRIRNEIGSAVDFLGGEAVPHFLKYFKDPRPGQLGAYNFRITEWNNLVLIDTNLLDPVRAPRIIRPFINAMIDLQHSLMAELIQSEGLKRDVSRSNHHGLVGLSAQALYQVSRVAEAVKRSFSPPQIPLG